MIHTIVSDFSKVLLFPKDSSYKGSLNALHKQLLEQPNYNPLDYFVFNQELLRLYTSLKMQYPLYIFTSDAIQDAPEFQPILNPIFTGILSAKKMNTDKKLAEAYIAVAKELSLNPEEIVYIDDSMENIEAAKAAGLTTHHYVDFTTLSQSISIVLS